MKKLIALLSICIIVLVGCSGSDVVKTDPNEQVTLKVMSWAWGTEGDEKNPEQAIVAQFEKDYPNVKIEMISAEGDYEDDLSQMIAAGNAPDVFVYAGIDPELNGWTYDVSPYLKDNESYKNMSSIITDAFTKDNGSSYAIPISVNFMAIFQSNKVLNELNQTPLEYGFSTEEFMSAVENATTDKTLGISNFDVYSWMPVTMEGSKLEWYNFDGEKYDYSNEYFTKTVENAIDLCSKGAVEACNSNVIPEGTWAFDSGKLAYQYEGTWQSKELLDKYDWKFVGLPGGEFSIIPDYMYVSATTQYPDVATDFITYFADEGYKVKYDMAVENNGVVPIPLVQNDEYVQLFKDVYGESQPNLVKAYEDMMAGKAGIVEGYKVIPRYNQSVKEGETGLAKEDGSGVYTVIEVMNEVQNGNMKYDDVKADLEKIANDGYQEGLALLES